MTPGSSPIILLMFVHGSSIQYEIDVSSGYRPLSVEARAGEATVGLVEFSTAVPESHVSAWMDPRAAEFLEHEGLLAAWRETEEMLRAQFGSNSQIETGLRDDMDAPNQQYVRVVIHLRSAAEAAWDAYRAFIRRWTAHVPQSGHEKFSFALELA